MSYLTVGKENSGNIDLYYEDHGTGKPVVLIHGWPLSGRSWEKQTAALLGAGYRVITYDRRGFGESEPTDVGLRLRHHGRGPAQAGGQARPSWLCVGGFFDGRRRGRAISGQIRKQRGEQGSFHIVDTALPAQDRRQPVRRGRQCLRRDQASDRRRPSRVPDGVFLEFLQCRRSGGKLVSDLLVRSNWIVAVGASPKGTLDCVSAWLTDFRNDLPRIDVPTLVIHGDADRILPIDITGKRTQTLVKGSKLAVVKDGPHGLIWTHAEQVNRELLGFFGK